MCLSFPTPTIIGMKLGMLKISVSLSDARDDHHGDPLASPSAVISRLKRIPAGTPEHGNAFGKRL